MICRDGATIGIGAGQMSRVDAVRIAIEKAQDGVGGGALASDAYFPFADGPQLGLDAGVSAIVQPGGSIRDNLTSRRSTAAGRRWCSPAPATSATESRARPVSALAAIRRRPTSCDYGFSRIVAPRALW